MSHSPFAMRSSPGGQPGCASALVMMRQVAPLAKASHEADTQPSVPISQAGGGEPTPGGMQQAAPLALHEAPSMVPEVQSAGSAHVPPMAAHWPPTRIGGGSDSTGRSQHTAPKAQKALVMWIVLRGQDATPKGAMQSAPSASQGTPPPVDSQHVPPLAHDPGRRDEAEQELEQVKRHCCSVSRQQVAPLLQAPNAGLKHFRVVQNPVQTGGSTGQHESPQQRPLGHECESQCGRSRQQCWPLRQLPTAGLAQKPLTHKPEHGGGSTGQHESPQHPRPPQLRGSQDGLCGGQHD
jgi:hypothetical protein